jgi:hypothetical protein
MIKTLTQIQVFSQVLHLTITTKILKLKQLARSLLINTNKMLMKREIVTEIKKTLVRTCLTSTIK